MKEVRVTEVPVPGLGPKIPQKSSQKTAKPQLSKEFVANSSEEEFRNSSQGKKSNLKKNANAKSSKTVAAPATKPNGTSGARRAYSESESESDGDSGSKSESEGEGLKEHGNTDVLMKDFNDTTGDGESESEDSANKSNGSGEEDGSVSSGEEDSGSEDTESEELNTDVRENASAGQSTSSQLQTVEFRPPPPFEPPNDFKAVTGRPASSSNILKLFNQSSLSGKQIWHITAPAGVPITSIKEVALEKIARGETVLSYKGVEYGFNSSENQEQGITKLLVPGPDGYVNAPSAIYQTLNLQQVVNLPKLINVQADPVSGSATTALFSTNSTKPVRQQPKGLRMRFLPSGFGDEDPGILGSSDSETSAPARQEFRMPNGSRHALQTEKRSHDEANGANQIGPSPTKKPKKMKDQDGSMKKMEKARKREKEMSKTKMKP